MKKLTGDRITNEKGEIAEIFANSKGLSLDKDEKSSLGWGIFNLAVGVACVGMGIWSLIDYAFSRGCRAYSQGDYNALDALGLIQDVVDKD